MGPIVSDTEFLQTILDASGKTFQDNLSTWLTAPGLSAEEAEQRLVFKERYLKSTKGKEGDLYLSDLIHLTCLPAGIEVRYGLDLRDCTSFVSLPKDLKVGGDIYLSGCTNLKNLPNNLTVHGDFELDDCHSLESLPINLEVNGYLYMKGCVNLKRVSEGLKVSGSVNMTNCTILESLPDDLEVTRNLYLEGCQNLRSLPKSITHRGPNPDGETRHIYLAGSGISPETIAHIKQDRAANGRDSSEIEFHFEKVIY